MNIGAISYSISAFTFLIFLAILLTDRHKGSTKKSLVIAASVSCVWSFVLAYESLMQSDDVQISIVEYFKSVSWIFLLVQLLSIAYSNRFTVQLIKKAKYGIFLTLVLLILPELSKYFDNFIHEPWTMPLTMQQEKNCKLAESLLSLFYAKLNLYPALAR